MLNFMFGLFLFAVSSFPQLPENAEILDMKAGNCPEGILISVDYDLTSDRDVDVRLFLDANDNILAMLIYKNEPKPLGAYVRDSKGEIVGISYEELIRRYGTPCGLLAKPKS